MKILRNFTMGLYVKMSMLKGLWEDISKANLVIKLVF